MRTEKFLSSKLLFRIRNTDSKAQHHLNMSFSTSSTILNRKLQPFRVNKGIEYEKIKEVLIGIKLYNQ